MGVFDVGISPGWDRRRDCGKRGSVKQCPVAVHAKA